ncbi:MAG: FAD:protein FMN transferase [Flavobacteriales bacterium]|nr:FAD:protein FMN transferase [Flavobacteriales bacterium]
MRKLYYVLIALVLSSCSNVVRKEAAGFTQGTTYSVIYFNNGQDLQYQVDSLLLAFDRALSTYQESSYISKWNRNEVNSISQPQLFKNVVKRSIEVNAQTDGAFDITVSPLMKYWFSNDWNSAKIDSTVVDSIMNSVGMKWVELKGEDYLKTKPEVQLDVNAIAQGYSVDVLAHYLESLGIFNYLVEIGGEVRASGTKPNAEAWTVGIDRPTGENLEHEIAMTIELNNRSLATSGNYRKFVEINGQKLGHSLDPITGFPATTDVLSATVIAKDCMSADAFATACMVMGFERAKTLIESNGDLDAILIYSDTKGVHHWNSAQISSYLSETP